MNSVAVLTMSVQPASSSGDLASETYDFNGLTTSFELGFY